MRRGGLLILLLGLLLIVGAGAVFVFLQPGGSVGLPGESNVPTPLPTEDPGQNVVRARVDIAQNTVISDTSLLELFNIPTAEYQENEDQYFLSVDEVANQLSTVTILAGTIIRAEMLTEPGLAQQLPVAEPDRSRDKAYPFVVNNLSGVADQVKVGDFVDIVATFEVSRRESYPIAQTLQEQAGQQVLVTQREVAPFTYRTTKTIIQRAQVMRILRPEIPIEGTPEEGGETPAEGAADGGNLPRVDSSGQPITEGTPEDVTESTITSGLWTVVLALNNQEVELMEFALNTNARVVLVLRGAGDSTYEPTIGATMDLLINEFGVPLPDPQQPYVFSEEVAFTGLPTPTPAPTRIP